MDFIFLRVMEVWTQWVPCKVNITSLTLHIPHCVHTSMTLRKMKFISSLNSIDTRTDIKNLLYLLIADIWATSWQNQQCGCAPSEDSVQRGHLPSLISLRCPHEASSGPKLPTECTAKTLIRLGRCPGWSESLLGSHAILLVLSRGGSFILWSSKTYYLWGV